MNENEWDLYQVFYQAPGGAGMGHYEGVIEVWAESPEDAEYRAQRELSRAGGREVRIMSVN